MPVLYRALGLVVLVLAPPLTSRGDAVPLPLSQSPAYTCGVDTPFIHAASSPLLVVTLPRLIRTRLMPHPDELLDR